MKTIIRLAHFLLILILLSACTSEPAKTAGTSPTIKDRIASEAKPQQPSIFINPDKPTVLTPLTAAIVGLDAKDAVYKWEKNNSIISGETSSSLANTNFKKGDQIIVSAAASDGKNLRSEQTTILNAPPEIVSAKIEPEKARKKDIIKISVEAKDPDGDAVTIKYKWKRNNTAIPEAAGPTLSLGSFAKKDIITVDIIPFDGKAEGRVRIGRIEIFNSPPVITSSPSPVTGNTYSYQVIAQDPDGDKISYTLSRGPSGMSIDTNTGILKWTFTEKDSGDHAIEIKVSDPDGNEVKQSFNLTISFK